MEELSLRKLKKALKKLSNLYRRKKHKLPTDVQKDFEDHLSALHVAIKERDKQKANDCYTRLVQLSDIHLKRSPIQKFIDVLGGLAFALLVAILIRQMWFEFYSIPSGSMRPTFKEKDYLVVSKTDYSLNIPLRNDHFYFDDSSLKRGNIVIFNGGGMDIPDVDTRYFFLFPGKKQYIKRLIGKPGDTLYFYGGQIYGIDKDGNPIQEFSQKPWFENIEHIPFIHFYGKIVATNYLANGIFSPVYIYQMNEPVAKLEVTPFGSLEGSLLTNKNIQKYADLWGFKNFAMARLLTKEELQGFTNTPFEEDAELYLELKHNPKLKPLTLIKDEYQRTRPGLSYEYSYIPLNDTQLREIFQHITTARFVVKNQKAYRYGYRLTPFSIDVPNVEDGIYEVDNGTLYKVYLDSFFEKLPNSLKNILGVLPLGGFLKKMPENHPLNQYSVENVHLLYNLGIEVDTRFSNIVKHPLIEPSRYAYFKNEELFLLGYPILKKCDENLTRYIENEKKKQRDSISYDPFIDSGPPLLADGNLDVAFIQQYGITIPEKSYLVLGDNHAMSADSREFGFVPQSNLKGGANFIFWPANRIGKPLQPSYPAVNFPKVFVWVTFLIISALAYIYYRKRRPY
ncbi:MAG: hypothetical protein COT84_02640 [Chlamydiae bacterium CG10_big_fil_rev_8_21_14_0_10_35_9]|nr:MAG: hypothetical protein COT84_02640 [Chlamydiae bacterium CG10_big_fil_rev_8_21_14_0_10_35_9]